MSASQEARKEVSKVIKEKIQNAKSVVFVKFNGLTVAEDTELRREFRKNNVEYKVLKNTLIKRAFNDLNDTQLNIAQAIGVPAIANRAEAEKAIAALNDKDVLGRKMRVNEAKNTITE